MFLLKIGPRCEVCYTSCIYLIVISSKLCDEIFHEKRLLKFFRKAEENFSKTRQIYNPNRQLFNFVRSNQQKTAAKTLL